MNINYVKVNASDANVVELAKQCGEKATVVAAMLNQAAYRKAYNKAKQVEMKQLRAIIKQHPELLKGEGR